MSDVIREAETWLRHGWSKSHPRTVLLRRLIARAKAWEMSPGIICSADCPIPWPCPDADGNKCNACTAEALIAEADADE